MSELDPHDDIAQLEARIEDLAETIERCRKIDLASKVAMTGGGVWLLCAVLGIVGTNVTALIAAMTAVIGGIVAFGSNAATARQASAAMAQAETLRADLIGRLRLRVVDGQLTDQDR